ncbi:XerD Site-specific recombinase XerD [actinobacterium SCGC AAA044-D11]|jgi:integrase/recombinase XerD
MVISPNTARAVSEYLSYAAIERGLSKNTISSYKRDLEKFALYLGRNGIELKSVDHSVVDEFLASLRGSGGNVRNSESSNSRAIVTVRNLFRFLSMNSREPNPLHSYAPPKIPKRLPKALSFDEMLALIEASKFGDDSIALRNNALLEILYATGARISEIVNLEMPDVAQISDNFTIKLLGKGGGERVVPIGNFARSTLERYLTSSRPDLLKTRRNNHVFLNTRGGTLSRQSAWEIITVCAERAKIKSHVTPHAIRHSFATHLLDGGADIRVVQELLGHASVTTTQIYTLVTIDKLRESYATSHPRAQ